MGVCYMDVYDSEELSSLGEFLAIVGTDTVVHEVATELGVVPIDSYVDHVPDNDDRSYHRAADALDPVELILKTCNDLPEERFAAGLGKDRVIMELEGLKKCISDAADVNAGFALALFL